MIIVYGNIPNLMLCFHPDNKTSKYNLPATAESHLSKKKEGKMGSLQKRGSAMRVTRAMSPSYYTWTLGATFLEGVYGEREERDERLVQF